MKVALIVWFGLMIVSNLIISRDAKLKPLEPDDRRAQAAIGAVMWIAWLYAIVILL